MSRLILPRSFKQRQRGFIVNPYAHLAGGGGGTLHDEIMADGPAFYYTLGETSGTNANNETSGADGVYDAGVTLNQTPLYTGGPRSILLSASTDSVMTIPASVQTATSGLTLVAIVKPTNVTGVHAIVCRDPGANRIYQWRINGRSLDFVRIVGSVDTYTVPTVVTINTTCILHVTLDGSNIKFYRNGIQVGTTGAFTAADYGHATTDITVGYCPGAAAGFVGNVSEVAGFSSALSAARCLAHAHAAGF